MGLLWDSGQDYETVILHFGQHYKTYFLFGQHNEIGKLFFSVNTENVTFLLYQQPNESLFKLNSYTVIIKSVNSAYCSGTFWGLLASMHFIFIFCIIWLG